LMQMTEELVSQIVLEINGSYHVEYQPALIDFTPPWRRVSMIQGLNSALGESLPPLDAVDVTSKLLDVHARHGIKPCSEPHTVERLVDNLVSEIIEPQCVNPTFIIEHPEVMSPLAKPHRNRPGLIERFELFVAKKEFCNAYAELNDPVVQRERFAAQARAAAEGDDEAMMKDEDFCVALEHGLPPTAGWGLGVDRLTMFLTNQNSIREVLLFPAMKPLQSQQPVRNQHEPAKPRIPVGVQLWLVATVGVMTGVCLSSLARRS